MRHLSGTLLFVLILLSIGCKGFAYRNVSAGMAPTLNVDDKFTVNPYAYSNRPVERFDIIVFDASQNSPRANPEAPWVKRVIGLPGETVEMRKGIVFVNGEPLEEP